MTHAYATEPAKFTDLMTALGRDPDSGLIVSNKPLSGEFRAAHRGRAAHAASAIKGLTGDVYFSSQPMRIPDRGRGGAKEVLGLTCLFADLDANPGKLETIANCWRVIELLTDELDAQPAAVVASGHGLQPYWTVIGEGTTWDAGDEVSAHRAAKVLKEFGTRVEKAATAVMGLPQVDPSLATIPGLAVDIPTSVVDDVYELARVLRVPGTWNHKSEPVRVDLARMVIAARPLTFIELEDRVRADPPPGVGTPPLGARTLPATRYLRTVPDTEAQLSEFKARLASRGLNVRSVRDTRYADGYEWRSTCPAHGLDGESHSPDALSFGLLAEDHGPVLVWHCFAGCEQRAVTAALGLHLGTPASRALTDGARKSVPVGRQVAREALKGRFLFAAGIGWHQWNGIRWQRLATDDAVLDAIARWVDDWLQRLVSEGAGSQVLREAARYRDIGEVKKLLAAARLEAGIVVEGGELDANPGLINVLNGVVDLRTMELLPHDPRHLMSKVAGADYDPSARHPDWDKALQALADEETRRWIQKLAGAAATGLPDRTGPVTFHQGGGANGKSTVIGAMRAAFGDYAVLVPDKLLTGSGNEHETMWMPLHGARFAYLEELPEDHVLPVARIKKLAETAEITARRMHQDHVSWRSTHTLVVSTNYMPLVTETDHGTWRRLAMVPYPHTYHGDARDPLLRRRLTEPEQLNAILAWIIAGAAEWMADGQSMEPLPRSIQQATREWRGTADLLAQFLERRVEATGNETDHVPTTLLHQVFNEDLPSGSQSWSQAKFSTRLKAHYWMEEHGLRVGSDSRKRAATSLWGARLRSPFELFAEGAEGAAGDDLGIETR